jgi:Fur family ferric uptake transcriptional regulator
MTDPTSLLRESGVAITAQRIAVLEAVSKHPHATAEAIAGYVRGNIGTISKQAVYDSLGTLSEKGLLRRIQPSGSPALYESRVGDNHHHLVCRTCSKTVDIDCAVGAAPCLSIAHDHGFHIEEVEVIYWGKCPACSSKISKS